MPAIRINKAKGHSYIQVKGYMGMNNWVTVGKATSKNLGYAERIVRDLYKARVSDEVNELGKIHGLLDTNESKKEYSDASREHPLVDYNIHEDELETAFDETKKKFDEESTKSMHRTRDRQRKAAKKAMRKLVDKLKIDKIVVVSKQMREQDMKDLCEKIGKKVKDEDSENWYLE